MPSPHDRPDLLPQGKSGVLRAYGLALLIHLLLAAALTWGVSWKSQDKDASFSAELWSALPQEAAPPLADTPPETPDTPPTPPQPPTPVAPPAPAAPSPSQVQAQADAEIALAREKRKRQEAEAAQKAQLAEKAKQEQAKADKAKQDKARADREKAEKDKAEAQRKANATAQTKAAQAKAAETKAAKDAEAKRQAQAEARQQAAAEKLRKDNIARMMGMAGGTGAADSKGTAAQASGPSASYAGRVRARIKPNVIFTEEIVGNPVAEVEVRTSLDGTIISQRLVKSSGNKNWDEAVIKAIIRTEVLPRDVDGRVPSPLIISFRPKD